MSEAIVDFKEVSDLLAPAFKGKLVRVVWDEDKATVNIVNKEGTSKLKAYGSLSEYADPLKIAKEKEALPATAVSDGLVGLLKGSGIKNADDIKSMRSER